jgi:hypothetical protein
MNKDFVPYKEALALRELGFNEPCITWYFDTRVDIKLYPESQPGSGLSLKGFKNSHKKIGITDCTAPLYQQAFRWFRDKYGLYPNIMTSIESYLCGYEIWDKNNEQSIDYSDNTDDWNMTYEEAELSCLRTLIKIVKDE